MRMASNKEEREKKANAKRDGMTLPGSLSRGTHSVPLRDV